MKNYSEIQNGSTLSAILGYVLSHIWCLSTSLNTRVNMLINNSDNLCHMLISKDNIN